MNKDIKSQSTEEWLAHYDGCKVSELSIKPQVVSVQSSRPILLFDSFRTTKKGRLVISLRSKDYRLYCDVFFNVSINHQRGDTSKSHETGRRGQFFPLEGSDFRKFWMRVFGSPPNRWCRVHKEMHKLGGFEFTGELVDKKDSKGRPYIQCSDFRVIGTEESQKRHNHGTN